MIIYSSYCGDIPVMPSPQDPSEVLDYTISYSASDWAASTEYFQDDVILPTTKQGIYLVCVQGGLSGSTEPTWSTKNKYQNTDNSVIWKTIQGSLALQGSEVITSSTWKSDAPYIFTHGGINGSLPTGTLVTGATSGATGYIERAVTDDEIYINKITGTFQSGEKVYDEAVVSYVTLSNAGTDTITLSDTNTTISATVFVGETNKVVSKVTVTNTIVTDGLRTIERSFILNIEDK